MHRRALHIAGLFLLLASLGTAEAAKSRDGAVFAAPYVRVLIAQQEAAAKANQARLGGVGTSSQSDDAAAAKALHRDVWAMRAPSLQAFEAQAVSSGL